MTRDGRRWADRAQLASIGQIVIQPRERADGFHDESPAWDRTERLRVFAAQLAAAVTLADVAEAVVAEGIHTLRATVAALALAGESGELEVAADAGGLLTGEPPFHTCAAEILAGVLTSAEPQFLNDVKAAGWRFPQAARCLATRGLAAAVIMPLVVQGAALGVVIFAFDRPQTSDAARRGFLEVIAGQAAQALERARLHNTVIAERAVHEQTRRRAEFAADLLASLDAADGTVRRIDGLLDALVPDIADFASVELLDESGRPAVAAVRHRDPALQEAFELLRREHSIDQGIAGSVADVAATGRPHLFELSPGSGDEYSLTPPALGLLGRLRPRSVMTLPLGPPGRRLGALLVGMSDSRERAFGSDDLAYFDVLAQQVGLSLDNAQLSERHREVSLRLQQSMLADSVPELPGLAVAAYYEPAAPDLEVGGDWCEAIELPDGRVGLFVGDVVGRGLSAAAAMGQLRAAVNALALTCDTPATLIDRLALFAETIPAAHCATVAAAILDRHTGELVYACAAHPPPLIISADGEARFLEGGRSVPLVVPSRGPRTDAYVTLAPGTRLVLYSDGLVERRGESIDVGLARLATAAGTQRRLPGNAFVAGLVADLTVDQHRLDDIAVLCVDLATAAGVRFLRRFSTSPHELAGLRVAMRDWFAANDIAAADANDILLAVGEAVANVVEHAYAPGTSGDVEVELVLDGGQMTLRIRDRGIWNLLPAAGDRGRGLPLMRAVSDVDVRRSLSGTSVTMRRQLGRMD
jgi:serine/threonine-protein kinase RsbW